MIRKCFGAKFILIFFGCVVMSFVFLVLFSIALTSLSSDVSGRSIRQWKYYQSFKFDPKTNSTRKSIVRYGSRISKDEFVGIHNVDGSYEIISTVTNSDSRYECIGSCVCIEHVDRRNSAHVLKSGFYFLAAAVSTSFAMKFSKKYFESVCVREYSGLCPGKVLSDVESCMRSDINDEYDPYYTGDKQLDEEEIVELVNESFNKGELQHYYCRGFCCENEKLTYTKAKKAAAVRNCEGFETEGWIAIFKSKPTDPREQFRLNILQNFCEEAGQYWVDDLEFIDFAGVFELCVSHHKDGLENVICEQVL